ncbi:MAG: type II secretion system F family protein [Myxococcota bacterium]
MSNAVLFWAGGLFVTLGAGAMIGLVLSSKDNPVRRLWHRYEQRLDGRLKSLFIERQGRHIARPQGAVVAVLLVASLGFRSPLLSLAAIVFAAGPLAWLEWARQERVSKIESQLEGWLQLVASALRSSGGMGSAVQSTVSLVPKPLQEELELVVRKTQLGVTLERSLEEFRHRTDSQTVAGALSTIIVGQRTGGDIPRLLETAAESLREMARLEGLVRAKTAQAKLQTAVMALLPFVFLLGLEKLRPGWFEPLLADPRGYYAVAGAALAWLAAIALSAKILQVED